MTTILKIDILVVRGWARKVGNPLNQNLLPICQVVIAIIESVLSFIFKEKRQRV